MTSVPEGEPARESRIRLDVRNLRGIAHPVRVRMLAMLRDDGPATATGLARRLGLNTGATSYHLRQLAAHGFVVEDAGRGTARERWWRAAHQTTLLERADLAGDDGLGWAYLRSVAELYADDMLRAVDELPTLPEPWRGTGTLSDYPLRLTPDELRSLVAEITAVIHRYRPAGSEDAPVGSAPVTFQFQAFRRPGAG